ncbi:MAG: AAA family ATPase [Clostridia bacterium]|nr:AAA family ATPase [Clostridia bacterium]
MGNIDWNKLKILAREVDACNDLTDDNPECESEDEPLSEIALTPAELATYIKKLRHRLKQKIFGQDNAINTFLSGYFRSMLPKILGNEKEDETHRPMTFLFAGPPGTGKTLLAEEIASLTGRKCRRFDMSEYAGYVEEMFTVMIGSAPSFKEAEAGKLTSFVEKHPDGIIIFDEIEKTSPLGINMFLQLLDSARLTDRYTDKTVDFSDTIIIMTTNAGRQLYEDGRGDFSTLPQKVIISALKTDVNPETKVPFFPPALCSRFAHGNVAMFNRIKPSVLRGILKNRLLKAVDTSGGKDGFEIELDENIYTVLLFAQGGDADARTISGRSEAFLAEELYEILRLVPFAEKLKKIKFTVDLSTCDAQVREMFENSKEKTRAIVVAPREVFALCKEKFGGIFDMKRATDAKSAINDIRRGKADLALLDFNGERRLGELNIEDVPSAGRTVLNYIRENGEDEISVYGLCAQDDIGDEEKSSLMARGVCGFIDLNAEGEHQVADIAVASYQNKSAAKLARHNQVIKYETRQSISEDGAEGEICLFDLKLAVAATSEDAKELLKVASVPDVSFADIIGAEDAKDELREFVSFLKNPRKYAGTGLNQPRGALFYGPPGTGKTKLAKAVAAEAGVTFIATEGNKFLKGIVGEGPDEVHRIFRIARKYSPTVLFIDEIDAIGAERGSERARNSENILTAFLAEMDGFNKDTKRPVLVIAATNYDVKPGTGKSLDEALVRRFDRSIYIDLPTKDERRMYLAKKRDGNPALAKISDLALANLADRSIGMSIAKLELVIDMALRSAVRRGLTKVTDEVLDDAFETFAYGEEKVWSREELLRVARHEAGHALMCHLCGETPSYLTVVSRGEHGGYMQYTDSEKHISTKGDLVGKIRTSLAGRGAEIVCYGDEEGVSTGAGADLASATLIAKSMICAYGMDDEVGLAVMERPDDRTNARINEILNEQMEKTIALIRENKDKLDALVDELMAKNSLNGKAIADILK